MPAAITLWHGNLKINTDERGFNFKFHIANNDEAIAKAAAVDIASRIKALLPSSAEIFFATISKDNTAKDSRFLKDAVGAGTYVSAGATPPPSDYDWSGTSILVRFEHSGGSSVTRKVCCIPDEIIFGSKIILAITPVTVVPVGVIPAPGAGATFADEFTSFMKAFVEKTVHVKSGHVPGEEYISFPWTSAFPLRVGQKKGGRVFI